jgi:Adenylate cyclase, family 3 (some proteins contain HAMP domain)
MQAFLNFEFPYEKQKLSLGPLTTIGRSKTNDLVLPDPKVSRNHSLLRCLGEGKYYLVDMGSANGTYLNGKRVIVPILLKSGDVIQIGSNFLIFQIDKADQEIPSDFTGNKATDSETTIIYNAPVVQEVTVLVADIRDYTSMSEQLPIDILAKLLGEWFRSVNDVIERNAGGVDKFIGDAVMACWLINEKNPGKDVRNTLKAAYELHVVTELINQSYPQLQKPLQIGVGINTGEAVVGDMGSGRLQDYTVLGDSVNLAFRLEKASKELKTDLVISSCSFSYLPRHFWDNRLSSIAVKGKDEPVRVCLLKFPELLEVIT